MKRFIDAHQRDFDKAFKEVRNKKKITHWMWYIFPQLKHLGYSSTAKYYGIASKEEALEYISTPLLKKNMEKMCEVLLEIENCSAVDIFGDIDAMKLQSCMTLFYLVTEDDIFKDVLLKYYDGKLDKKTKYIIENL